jgi:hypothetical protein
MSFKPIIVLCILDGWKAAIAQSIEFRSLQVHGIFQKAIKSNQNPQCDSAHCD